MLLKVLLVVAITVSVIQAQINPNRLPSDVYPTAYELTINTQNAFDSTMFSGKVNIELNVRAPTNNLTLNLLDLDFQVTKLYEIRGDERIEIPVKLDLWMAFEQMVVIMSDVSDAFQVGRKYILTIEFEGWVNNIATGLYIRQGRTDDGTRVSLLSTNFVPISARQAFPCYDEPEFKATYKLTLLHDSKYSAISNMPIETATTNNEETTTTFMTTPLLSPHSLGFVVTEFKSLDSVTNGKHVAYYDQTHDKEDVSFVLEAGEKILKSLELYLDTDIGVPKIQDVPQFDYSYAKIGHLGLVLNEMRYYYINSTSTQFQYDEVIRHVSRLMANQFFGNIIAPAWWDDVWFIRGLSILFEYYILETDYPEFKSKDSLMVKLYSNFYELTVVFREVDMSDLTRFLITDLYEWKGTEIIFMLQNILTEDIFKLALRTLLFECRNVPVSTQLFFDVLTRVGHENGVLSSNHDLNTIMETWILSESNPILEVARDYETGIVTLKQDDYLNYIDYQFSDEDPVWWLPYNYVTENGDFTWSTLPNGWMEEVRTKDLDFGTNLQSVEWILFNVKQTGFYHTLYDHTNWIMLAKQLSKDHEKIHYTNRGHLVSDAFKFGYLNYTTLDVAFEAANYLNNETSTFPFRILFTDEFTTIVSNLYGTDVYSNFTLFMRNKVANMYDRVRVSRDVAELDYDALSLRASLTKFACQMHVEACLEDAHSVFLKYYEYSDATIFAQVALDYESDLGTSLLRYGFILSDEEEFSYMFDRINHGSQNSVHYNIARIIGMCQSRVHTDRLMDILITKNGNSVFEYTIDLAHDIRFFIFETLIANNEYALDAAFLYLEDMYDQIMEIYGYDAPLLVKYIAARTTTTERFEKLLRIADLYTVEYWENFEYEIELANRTLEWNVERIGEFQDVLANLLEGRVEEENSGEEEPEPEEEDDGAASITISLFTLVLTSLIAICTKRVR